MTFGNDPRSRENIERGKKKNAFGSSEKLTFTECATMQKQSKERYERQGWFLADVYCVSAKQMSAFIDCRDRLVNAISLLESRETEADIYNYFLELEKADKQFANGDYIYVDDVIENYYRILRQAREFVQSISKPQDILNREPYNIYDASYHVSNAVLKASSVKELVNAITLLKKKIVEPYLKGYNS